MSVDERRQLTASRAGGAARSRFACCQKETGRNEMPADGVANAEET